MIYIFIIILFTFLIGQLIENLPTKLFAYFCSAVSIVVVFIFTLGISFTADWDMYYYLYKLEIDKTDFIYYNLSVLFNKYKFSFEYLFRFHIICTVFIYFFLISRFTKNFFFVFILYMLFDYIHFANQIRYYLGFPILMLGFYYLFFKKKYVISSILIIFSILCHSALSILLIFIPIYYLIPKKKYIKVSLYISVFAFLIVFIIFNSGLGTLINHFGFYLESENGSSVIGGLFNALPYILILAYLYIFTSKILKGSDRFTDPKFVFLYKITFFPIVLLPGSFLIQIIGHRYIMPFAIFWFIYYLYLIKDLQPRKKFLNFILFAFIVFVASFVIYILPDYVLKENHFAKELTRIVKSISYLKGILYEGF